MSQSNGASAHGEARLNDLYQEVILDHNKRPRNFGRLEGADHMAHGKNPLCGDDYFLYLKVDKNGKIEKANFEGSGCAISKASASMLTTFVEGKNVRDAAQLKDDFIRMLTDRELSKESLEKVGRLKIFEGVRQFPVRIKCAALIWRTLEEALKGNKQMSEISTE